MPGRESIRLRYYGLFIKTRINMYIYTFLFKKKKKTRQLYRMRMGVFLTVMLCTTQPD